MINGKDHLKANANLKAVRTFCLGFAWLGFLLLSSCASPDSAGPKSPAVSSFSRSAGRGGFLIVKVRLEDGRELPFMMDTGAPVTVLDTSLESVLGKVLGTNVVSTGWVGNRTNHLFKAPKLYLNGVELHGGKRIWVEDVHEIYPGVMGILGRDYLRHCRIQLDFSQCTISLLTPEQLKTNISGDDLQLSLNVGMNLLGLKGARTMVDTGDYQDGALDAETFQRQLQFQSNRSSIQEWADGPGRHERLLYLPRITFRNHTYTNLVLENSAFSSDPKMNTIGLRFLARHLVTFDFPNGRVYLKQNFAGPLGDSEVKAGMNFLRTLKRHDQVPGFLSDDKASIERHQYETGLFAGTYPVSITYYVRKQNDNSIYHYTVGRNAANGSWFLQKAWQTDLGGNVIKSFPLSSLKPLKPEQN